MKPYAVLDGLGHPREPAGGVVELPRRVREMWEARFLELWSAEHTTARLEDRPRQAHDRPEQAAR